MIKNSAGSSQDVFKDFVTFLPIRKKKVLEVGGVMEEELTAPFETEWVSVDPLYTPSKGYELVKKSEHKKNKHLLENITSDLFTENSFDYIFSCNAFHHIANLPLAFANFYRWLKKGGVLYAHFGPIWSAPDGAHIEGLVYEGEVYNFWEHKLTPFWSHLYFTEQEMVDFLGHYHPYLFARAIAHATYQSNWINRLIFSDYANLLKVQPWKVLEFGYSTDIDYISKNHCSELKENVEQAFLSKLLHRKKCNFFARDLLIIIQK